MAYTHYWYRTPHLDAEAFAKASADCKLLLAGIDVSLKGPQSQGEPVFSADSIHFNGIDGQNCEPFIVRLTELPRHPGRPVMTYCKTEKMPYDLCVKCALIILKHHMPDDIRVMSDGTDEDFSNAKQLCLSCLGYGSDFTLEKDE